MFKKVIIVFFISSFFTCEELIEVEDITNESITVLAPVDNSTFNASSINFRWEPLEFADQYEIQIATPSFESALQIVEDTIITATSFDKSLGTNQYEWRVRGINFAYETNYTTQSLTVEE